MTSKPEPTPADVAADAQGVEKTVSLRHTGGAVIEGVLESNADRLRSFGWVDYEPVRKGK